MTSFLPLGRPLSFHEKGDGGRTPQQTSETIRDSEPQGSKSIEVGDSNEYSEQQNTLNHSPDANANETRLSYSPSSSATAQEQSEETTRQQTGDELGEPSGKHLKRAGMAGVIAPLSGEAAQRMVAGGGDRLPSRWDEVKVDDKYHLWSPEIRGSRTAAIKKGAFLYGFITIWLWVCLSIFWGSNYKLETFFPRLTVQFVTFDNDPTSFLNGPMTNEARYQAGLPNSVAHLGWQVKSISDYPNGVADVVNNVLSQKCWMAVVVNANATTAWRNALETGDANYDPTGAITVYYQSARFYQVTLLYFEQILSQALANPLSSARGQAYASFLSSIQNNAAALTAASQVPQAIGTAFGYSIHDLRSVPNRAWGGVAPMEAALIYFVIFSFYLTLYGGMARMKSGLGNKLTLRSMIVLRFGWPLLASFFMSLWFTCIERAFQAPTEAFLGSGGFVTLWALNWLTNIGAGLALETALSIVGMPGLPLFLILWIILNITSSFYPIELMPTFYRFLYWTPFLHNVEGYKIIAYGTDLQHRLGLHFGVLFGLIGVELIFFPLSIMFERWTSDRSALREQAEKAKKQEN